MLKRLLSGCVSLACLGMAEIREHPAGKEIPHQKYIRVVSEADSPLQKLYIKTKDGLYVAAALRKPKGAGPFPALVYFHGAPGGRGMEKLVEWSLGTTGGPVWERFLQEGFVVVVSDYRHPVGRSLVEPLPEDQPTYADDGLAVVDHVRSLPYVDKDRISVYGVSLGGNVALHVISRTKLKSAILGAPAPMEFLGAKPVTPEPPNRLDRYKNAVIDQERARRNVARIQCPLLILVGTADALLHVDRPLHDFMEKAGKSVRMEIYENGYHDFCVGPQGHAGRSEPLLDSTLDALEKSVAFLK